MEIMSNMDYSNALTLIFETYKSILFHVADPSYLFKNVSSGLQRATKREIEKRFESHPINKWPRHPNFFQDVF